MASSRSLLSSPCLISLFCLFFTLFSKLGACPLIAVRYEGTREWHVYNKRQGWVVS